MYFLQITLIYYDTPLFSRITLLCITQVSEIEVSPLIETRSLCNLYYTQKVNGRGVNDLAENLAQVHTKEVPMRRSLISLESTENLGIEDSGVAGTAEGVGTRQGLKAKKQFGQLCKGVVALPVFVPCLDTIICFMMLNQRDFWLGILHVREEKFEGSCWKLKL